MKKLFLSLAILFLLGGLFSAVWFGVQYYTIAESTNDLIEREISEMEAVLYTASPEELDSYSTWIASDQDYYHESKTTSNWGFIIGGILLILSGGFFWKWKKT